MRLIDADKLPTTVFGQHPYGWDIKGVHEDDIKCADTIDAVPVVRCKDCKYYELDERSIGSEGKPLHYCDRDGGLDWFIAADMFCSYGEKR